MMPSDLTSVPVFALLIAQLDLNSGYVTFAYDGLEPRTATIGLRANYASHILSVNRA